MESPPQTSKLVRFRPDYLQVLLTVPQLNCWGVRVLTIEALVLNHLLLTYGRLTPDPPLLRLLVDVAIGLLTSRDVPQQSVNIQTALLVDVL